MIVIIHICYRFSELILETGTYFADGNHSMQKDASVLKLNDGSIVKIIPFQPDNMQAVRNFFTQLSNTDLLIYKDDVAKRENVDSWFTNSNYSKVFHIIGLVKDVIVASGTLHSQGLFWSHAVELKLIVHPDYRGKGLGSQLFNLLLLESMKLNFQKVIVRYLEDNASFVKILDNYGFKPESVLSFYVKDTSSGLRKDLVIASLSLENWSRRFEFYSFLYRPK